MNWCHLQRSGMNANTFPWKSCGRQPSWGLGGSSVAMMLVDHRKCFHPIHSAVNGLLRPMATVEDQMDFWFCVQSWIIGTCPSLQWRIVTWGFCPSLIRTLNLSFPFIRGGLNPKPWPGSHGNSKVKLLKVGIVHRWVTSLALVLSTWFSGAPYHLWFTQLLWR